MPANKMGNAGLESGVAVECPNDAALICAESLARMLDVSVRTLWRLRNSGKLPLPIKLGGSVRWRTSEILAWVAAGCPGLKEWERRQAG